MREFLTRMAGKTPEELADAVINVRLTRSHFDEARKKVKGSLDREALEAAERQAWEMLYSSEQRDILENALGAVRRAGLRKEKGPDAKTLEDLVFQRTKDWNEIKNQTGRLEEELRKAGT
jgi:transitional endoplasmic reticulum ATPase